MSTVNATGRVASNARSRIAIAVAVLVTIVVALLALTSGTQTLSSIHAVSAARTNAVGGAAVSNRTVPGSLRPATRAVPQSSSDSSSAAYAPPHVPAAGPVAASPAASPFYGHGQ
jgi:hypothetical protein